MRRLELPLLVAGRVHEDLGADPVRIRFESGLEVLLPRVDDSMVETLRLQTNDALAALSIDDVTKFLVEVGRRWGDPNYPLRRRALELATEITGYNERIIGRDLVTIADVCKRSALLDILSTDLGDPYLMDEWRPSHAVFRRATPRGKVLHVMVGNVPKAAMFTMVRSILTKNVTIAKLPSRDPVTSLHFALTCLDVDPEHPVSRSLTALYWEPGSELEDRILPLSDVVCVWGQRQAVDDIKRKLRYGQEFIEFGPKLSAALVGRDTPDWDYAAMRAAYDVSVYDQEACFSPQWVAVEGDPSRFVEPLCKWLDRYLDFLPRTHMTDDSKAHVTQKRLEAKLSGFEVHGPASNAWTVIVSRSPRDVHEHPLGRTLYVFSVDDLKETLPWISSDVQTLAVHPFARSFDLADEATRRGAARLVDLGFTSFPRAGFVHDGMLPLSRMVRWVAIERPLTFKYTATADPEDYDRELFGYTGDAKMPRPYRFVAGG
jgi:long-chain-fatty-acyl-CoA reductase